MQEEWDCEEEDTAFGACHHPQVIGIMSSFNAH